MSDVSQLWLGGSGPMSGMARFYSRRLYRIALWMHRDVSSVDSSSSDSRSFLLDILVHCDAICGRI
jgi:hypothetical protein